MIELYGIPNCDSVKKARRWLDEHGKEYAVHDYKKEGVDPVKLRAWSEVLGWETLLNRRGTTFRKLAEVDRADLDRDKAVKLMAAQNSLIKRPVVEHAGGLLAGFDEAEWLAALR